MEKVLITGGAGFIGSHLAEHLQRCASVRVLDDLRTGYRHNLDKLDVEFIRGSILDRSILCKAMKNVDVVYHLAAMVSVPESVRDPCSCVDLNVTGLLSVLEAAVRANARKFCFSSSAAVYGNNAAVPKREDMCPEPRSPYAVTKLDGEYYCRLFAETTRLETVALRFFNVFGPRQNLTGGYAAAVPIFLKRALADEPITIYGDGGQTRDFVYVKDIVAALQFVGARPGLTGVFNVGYGDQISIMDLARLIIRLTRSRSRIEFLDERPGDVRHSRACVEKLHKVGFRPVSSLEHGLEETLSTFMHRQHASASLV